MAKIDFLIKSKDTSMICGVPQIDVYIPSAFFDKDLAFWHGKTVKTVGFIYMDVYRAQNGKPKLFKMDAGIQLEINYSKMSKITKKINDTEEEYFVLTSFKGETVISSFVHIVNYQSTKNFLYFLFNGKLPKDLSYDKIVQLVNENAKLNNMSLGVPSVLIEVMIGELMRDSADVSIPFRNIAGKTGKKLGYSPIKLKNLPNISSVFAGLSFEDVNASIQSGLLMTREGRAQKLSPVETTIYY